MDQLIINFSPTGMMPTKSITPHVPISPNEIIEQVHKAYEIGITLVHLHARDEITGEPTYQASVYQKIMEGLRHHCQDLVLCCSLSGRLWNEFEKRSEVLELKPDMASLTLSSMNFVRQASINTPDMIQNLAKKMLDYGMKAELEVFDFGMINYAKYLISKNLLRPPYYFNLLFNNVAGMQPELTQIGLAIKELPDNSYWALAGIGDAQLAMNTVSIAMGGGVRFGLEDNIYFDKQRKVLASNIEQLKRLHNIAEIFERKIMPAKTFGNLGFYNHEHAGRKSHENVSCIG
jgi:3-keto-5-aminohexanoate cleavage enzyme